MNYEWVWEMSHPTKTALTYSCFFVILQGGFPYFTVSFSVNVRRKESNYPVDVLDALMLSLKETAPTCNLDCFLDVCYSDLLRLGFPLCKRYFYRQTNAINWDTHNVNAMSDTCANVYLFKGRLVFLILEKGVGMSISLPNVGALEISGLMLGVMLLLNIFSARTNIETFQTEKPLNYNDARDWNLNGASLYVGSVKAKNRNLTMKQG